MNRYLTTALVLLCGLAVAGCGSPASGALVTASPSPGTRVRNGAQGELVQINASRLVLNASAGDVTVDYTAATTFAKSSVGTFADITVGKCLVATGQKDPSGAITATAVRLSEKAGGACTQGGAAGTGPGGFGGRPGARRSPGPIPSPDPNFGFAAGAVTAVSGTTVTVQPRTGGTVIVSVPTTVQVTRSAPATAADLALHECVAANGPHDAGGVVTARAIQIVPAGPSGCFTGGRGLGGGR
ncbi:MAG: DUF5666 domain-containing protein [Candidatus Dormibacteria bacterium]